jgi:hypothetical protein
LYYQIAEHGLIDRLGLNRHQAPASQSYLSKHLSNELLPLVVTHPWVLPKRG